MAKNKKNKKLDVVAMIGRRGAEATIVFNGRSTSMDSRPKWARTRAGRTDRAIRDSAGE